VLHITISVAYLRTRRIENVILTVPYASHVLDVYTSRREDKRTLLQARPPVTVPMRAERC
jgi:hypothetical protein